MASSKSYKNSIYSISSSISTNSFRYCHLVIELLSKKNYKLLIKMPTKAVGKRLHTISIIAVFY